MTTAVPLDARAAYSATLDAGRRRHRDHQVAWPAGPDDETVRTFSRAHLADRWRICARSGVLAVQDRPATGAEPAVWLGSDSVRFFDLVSRTVPAGPGEALEVGSGSGLTTCRLARDHSRTTAIDLIDQAVAATTIAAQLNDVADAVTSYRADLEELVDSPPRRFAVVAANLPGVPIPPGVGYSPAGDGGNDGLRLVRCLLNAAPDLLDQDGGRLVMRFQSLGSPESLLCDTQIEELCARNGFDCFVESDQRVPIRVRALLTALYAAPHSPERDTNALLGVIADHYESLGCDYYYSSNLVLTASGSGRYRRTDTSSLSVDIDTALLDLPDEFFELGGADIWPLLETQLRDLADAGPEPDLEKAAVSFLYGCRQPSHRAAADIVFDRLMAVPDAH